MLVQRIPAHVAVHRVNTHAIILTGPAHRCHPLTGQCKVTNLVFIYHNLFFLELVQVVAWMASWELTRLASPPSLVS